MSGCVNCVWDRFRDEIEDWAAASAEAKRRQEKMEMKDSPAVSSSMDDDGGGSEALWSLDEVQKKKSQDATTSQPDLFEGIPIGIRAFIEQERKLKAKRKARGESAIIDMETKAKWLER